MVELYFFQTCDKFDKGGERQREYVRAFRAMNNDNI